MSILFVAIVQHLKYNGGGLYKNRHPESMRYLLSAEESDGRLTVFSFLIIECT